MESDGVSESNDEDSGCEAEPFEEVLLGKTVIEVPESFCSQKDIFFQVASYDTWENVLSPEQCQRLYKFLPNFPENDEEEKKKTIKKLFSGENFYFGNPLRKFFEQLEACYLAPDITVARAAVRMAQYREYKHQQWRYHFRLLQQVLISRKKLLDAAYKLPPDEPVKMQQFTAKPKNATLNERTRLRYFSTLQDVREECGELETSSEDENYPESSPPKLTKKHKKHLQMLEASLSPEINRITSTTAHPPGHAGSSHFLNRCLDMVEVSDERYREMLVKHKRRKLTQPNHPELDTSKVDLESMIARANLPKRPLVRTSESHPKKKPKPVEPPQPPPPPEKVFKQEVEKVVVDTKPILPPIRHSNLEDILSITNAEKGTEAPLPILQEKDLRAELKAIKLEMEDEEEEEPMSDSNFRISPTVPDVPQLPSSYFSVLRDMFCEMPEQKLSAAKLEEKVKAWQEGPTAVLHDWLYLQNSWYDLVSSALKFLAGDLLSILPENFVPFLDYKEKQQQWQWIGAGRDSEEELFALCQHWLENKDDVSLEMLETCQGSPPPPRVTTEWTVRATSDNEKAAYQEQERIRYQNPHRAFTFKVHGYESVVGPVKGVYGKESGVNKAREHSLLISDRPPFVTILSLVRDAAARLPNGEGTRADICELLKDSQYLAPASDQQIHTVVSGALDRLHYEKDPCVKYDVNRKLWIYLHRNRTEGEFERIHQAQAAAAKARKAVQKSKPPKSKVRDVPRTPPTASCSSVAESVAAILNVDVSTAISTNSVLHSPRGGSPRTHQNSPKQGHPSANRHAARTLTTMNQAFAKVAASALASGVAIPRKMEQATTSNLLPVLSHTSVATSICTTSPQHSLITSLLPQQQSDGSNSRPPSQGSVQSLPSPKTVIANVNAAQFGVSGLPVGPTTEPTSMGNTSCISVLSVDMKPSSPSFFGQPPVLQPVLNRQTMVTTSSFTPISTAAPPSASVTSVRVAQKPSKTVPAVSTSKVLPSFQTIVIKPDTSLNSAGLSALPLLSMEDIPSSVDSAILSNNPVVARLLQSSHLISLGNIMGEAVPSATLKSGTGQHQSFKIQGANISSQLLQTPTTPVVATATISNPQAVQPQTVSDIKIPRLSLVAQDISREDAALLTKRRQEAATLVSSIPLVGQSTFFQSTAASSMPGTEARVTLSQRDATEVKRMNAASQTSQGILRPSLADLSHILDCGGAPNQTITSSGNIITPPSTSSPLASYSKMPQAVIRGTQDALKHLPSTYVMTAPITNAAGLTTQHGLRAATPLNMRTLQSIKVIPVPQSLGANKNLRNAPLLAHIISPSTGVTVRAGVPAEFIHSAHNLKGASNLNILHGLQTVTSSSAHLTKPSSLPSTSSEVPSSQPFIIQVQAPKPPEEDGNS